VLKKFKIVLTKEDIENLANGEANEVEKLMFLIRKTLSEDGPSPTVMSKVSKVSKMTLGIGEKKREKKVYTFK
jgi:hypothetical protein